MPYIHSSDISGCGESGITWNVAYGIDGGRNLDRTPYYVTKGYNEFTGIMQQGDYHIRIHSPAVNTGFNYFVADIPTDLDRGERILYDYVDMGAYEFMEAEHQGLTHQVIVPAFANIETDPETGVYYVDAHTNFVVVLKPKSGYSLDQIRVTAGSNRSEEDPGTRLQRNNDGTITVTFVSVSEPIYVNISGERSIDAINSIESGYAVWSERGVLHVRTGSAAMLKVYNVAGSTVKQTAIQAGQTNISLSQGIYFVTLDDGVRVKVVVN
jgi:hypothetical protein